MSKTLKKPKPQNCLNCNHPLDEQIHFCPNCGQKALPDHLTLSYFLHEFLNNYFSFDSKFFNTVKQLIIKPSLLSTEFISGRRVKFINPIQLFIFSSFLYFLVNSFLFLKEDTGEKDLVRIYDNEQNLINDSIIVQQSDSLIIIQGSAGTDTLENSYLGELLKKGQDFNNLDKESQNEKISRNVSYAVFLLMPLFALYLGWFFKRKDKHYLENIIFSIHFHTFYYVAGVVFLLIDKLLPGDIDSIILNLLVIIYLLIALKKFYIFSWKSTSFRLLGLILIYGFTVSVFLVMSIIISVLV